MTEMLKRVAAILAAGTDRDSPKDWEFVAREVIAAMREPTEEMLRAGDVMLDGDSHCRWADEGSVWRAMIDAALEEDAS